RLVDEVDLERLENSRLRNVTDPALGHHGDRDGALNFADLAYGRHPGNSPIAPDVRRNPLERHDGRGTGLLGDLCLIRVDDVHDDAALQHLGQPDLDPETI